jgi:hypothetical protein
MVDGFFACRLAIQRMFFQFVKGPSPVVNFRSETCEFVDNRIEFGSDRFVRANCRCNTIQFTLGVGY